MQGASTTSVQGMQMAEAGPAHELGGAELAAACAVLAVSIPVPNNPSAADDQAMRRNQHMHPCSPLPLA